jgi:hypothetical protein
MHSVREIPFRRAGNQMPRQRAGLADVSKETPVSYDNADCPVYLRSASILSFHALFHYRILRAATRATLTVLSDKDTFQPHSLRKMRPPKSKNG